MTDHSALGGIRVLDLTEDRGLYTGKVLADFGAEVIKIEPPEGSQARRIGPFKGDIPAMENSLYFLNFNINKKGITLNLKDPTGKKIFKQLVRRADAVIEDFEVGKMKSLGLDYPVLRRINRRLILASITGFGQSGPYRDFKAPDIVSFAMSGMLYLSGSPQEPPVVAPCEQAYHSAAILTAFSILGALFLRLSTGEGQYIDTSTHEVMSCFNTGIMNYSATSGIGMRSGSNFSVAPARIYPCADGYVHILVIRANHWQIFVELLGNPEVLKGESWFNSAHRSQNKDLIDKIVTEFTMKHTKAEIVQLCQTRGIPCTPVNTPADISRDPHEKSRGFIGEIDHPVLGRHSYLGPSYSLSETPCRIERPAPILGQHNSEIYSGELEYRAEDLVRFKAKGII